MLSPAQDALLKAIRYYTRDQVHPPIHSPDWTALADRIAASPYSAMEFAFYVRYQSGNPRAPVQEKFRGHITGPVVWAEFREFKAYHAESLIWLVRGQIQLYQCHLDRYTAFDLLSGNTLDLARPVRFDLALLERGRGLTEAEFARLSKTLVPHVIVTVRGMPEYLGTCTHLKHWWAETHQPPVRRAVPTRSASANRAGPAAAGV